MEKDIFQNLSTGVPFGRTDKGVKDKYFVRVPETSKKDISQDLGENEIPPELDFFHDFANSKKKEKMAISGENDIDKSEELVNAKENEVGEEDVVATEQSKALRSAKVHTTGEDIPKAQNSFSDIFKAAEFPRFLCKLVESKYENPTPVQTVGIELAMNNRDIICIAPTGTGKTAVFLLPLIAQVHLKKTRKERDPRGRLHAVVVAPTRELAVQIHRHLVYFSKGGSIKSALLMNLNTTKMHLADLPVNDKSRIEQRYDIIVSTPMRITTMIDSKEISLSSVRSLVFDEADKLFAMDFLPQVDKILEAARQENKERAVSIAMYSATLYPQIEHIGRSVMTRPVRLRVGARNTATDTVEQELIYVGSEDGKVLAITQLLESGIETPILLFVQTQKRVDELFRILIFECPHVDYIHSGRPQNERKEVVNKFRSGKVWILITTDLMARGIDVLGIRSVINFDFPQSVSSYIHRVGRAGRAGLTGKAFTLFTESDLDLLRPIASVMRESGCKGIPEWVFTAPKMSKRDKRALVIKPPKRGSIIKPTKHERKRRAREGMRRAAERASKGDTGK